MNPQSPQKQELLDKLKGATNILVTVSANPTVDQLAACIGMTLFLNKLKKHATAVFSGEVPSTIEFLKPEETLEKNTDSLRDFIISLDKSKADKLRYKVEDQVVRIFITPYKTSISQDDLEFGQGDFNVDAVLCLGVSQQQDLDQAITTHGRILHDAVLLGLNMQPGGELGTLNWTDTTASSLSELVAEIVDMLGKQELDAQIATALLTGIVAETDRFSNEKTSPETMRLSAELMAAGANQQLVANELATPLAPAAPAVDEEASQPAAEQAGDGTLEIAHSGDATDVAPTENFELPEPQESVEPEVPSMDELSAPAAEPTEPTPAPASRLILQPPSMGGMLTANSVPESEPLKDPLSFVDPSTYQPLLDHGTAGGDEPAVDPLVATEPAQVTEPTSAPEPASEPLAPPQPVANPEPIVPTNEPEIITPSEPSIPEADVQPPAGPPASSASPSVSGDELHIDANGNLSLPVTPLTDDASGVASATTPPNPNPTLSDLEASVGSPHAATSGATPAEPDAPPANLDAARDAVMDAINSSPSSGLPEPAAAVGASGYLNVQDLPDTTDTQPVVPTVPDLTEAAANAAATQPIVEPLPVAEPPADPSAPVMPGDDGAGAPPPVPPPLPLDDLSKFTSPDKK